MLQLLVTACVVPSLPIVVILMKEAIPSSKTSVFARATWHYIQKDGIFIATAVKTSNLVCLKEE
jgi:hypothetical protein